MFAWRLSLTSYLLSAVVHASGLLVLALCILPTQQSAPIVLTLETEATTQFAEDLSLEFPLESVAVAKMPAADSSTSTPQGGLDDWSWLKNEDAFLAQPNILLSSYLDHTPTSEHWWSEVPTNISTAATSSIVNDYGAALTMLGQQISSVLENENVLLVWCFDQSISMKDDQEQIGEQINSIYTSIAVKGRGRRANVLSAITSYGEHFTKQTRKPTAELAELRRAIGAIPVDSSGFEKMCASLQRAMESYEHMARTDRRQLILILVTDETGDREGNERLLEDVIAAARQQKCRIFVLGREACFGTTTAFMKWRGKLMQIDRGPESAFTEQLASDGLGIEQITINSGFAPYEQARLAKETGGGLYLIKALEPTLLNSQITEFDPARLKKYSPDLRPRRLQLDERERNPLRVALKEVVESFEGLDTSDFELPLEFPGDRKRFQRKADDAIRAAETLVNHYSKLVTQLEEAARFRANETPRWKANYDLIYGQLVGYQAQCLEYQARLQQVIRETKGRARIGREATWTISRIAGPLSTGAQSLADEATKRLAAVQQEHSGTPWAIRATTELEQGFSVQLLPR